MTNHPGARPDYYVFTSLGLTPMRLKELAQACSPLLRDESHIYDRQRIEQFLQSSTPDSRAVIRSNLKLLGNISSLLFALCPSIQKWENKKEFFFLNFKEATERYYKTKVYYEAFKCLSKEKGVVLIGPPGSGKTITTKLIAAAFLAGNPDYKLTIAEHTEADELLEQLGDEKQLIVLDDVLGHIEFRLDRGDCEALEKFTSLSKRKPNTFVIINSRTTVFNDYQKNGARLYGVAKNGLQYPVVNCDELAIHEKEWIFYGHFVRATQLSLTDIKSICLGRGFDRIVRNSGYNPRLIEYITSNSFVDGLNEPYIDAAVRKLINPAEIWSEEFERRINQDERRLLFIMASIGFVPIEESDLKRAFLSFLKLVTPQPDMTLDHFQPCLNRLTASLITRIKEGKKVYYRFVNPSVYEVALGYLNISPESIAIIVKTAICYDQLGRFVDDYSISNDFLERFNNKNLNSLLTFSWDLNRNVFQLLVGRLSEISIDAVKHYFLVRPTSLTIYGDEFRAFLKMVEKLDSSHPLIIELLNDPDLFENISRFVDGETIVELYRIMTSISMADSGLIDQFATDHFDLVKSKAMTIVEDKVEEIFLENASEIDLSEAESAIDDLVIEEIHEWNRRYENEKIPLSPDEASINYDRLIRLAFSNDDYEEEYEIPPNSNDDSAENAFEKYYEDRLKVATGC